MTELEQYAQGEALKAEAAKARQQAAKERAKKIDLEAAIVRTAAAWFTQQPAPKMLKPERDGRRKHHEVAVACYTDPHLGAVGIDYNSGIARARTLAYAERICEIAAVQRADHPVRDLRVWVLGDIVQGELIYPTAPYEADMTLMEQLTGGGLSICRDFLLRLAADFEHVHVVWIPGNHGRIGSTKGAVFHPDTNADRILAAVVRLSLANETRITWEIPRAQTGQIGWCHVDRIGNYSALLLHGHQFRGGSSYGGIPFYGITRKALMFHHLGGRVAGLPVFDDIYCGHYHRIAKIKVGAVTVRIGGSLQTTSPYELEQLAAYTPPAQLAVFVHPERGIVTSEYEVYLT